MNSLLTPLFNGFILGITTGPACFTACVPVLLSVSLSDAGSRGSRENWLFLAKFLGGRFGAYLLFGLVLGLIGDRMGPVGPTVGAWATVVLSVVLVAYGFGLRLPHWGACRWAGRVAGGSSFPLILGVLTGLNVCPPFLLAISYTLQRAISPLTGLLFFFSFFIATSLYVLPVGFAGYLPGHQALVRIGRGAAVLVGAYFCFQGVSALMLG